VVRRVLRFAKPYRFLIAVFVALVVILAALAVAPPLLFKEIIDRGVLQGDRRVVIIVSLILAGIAVLQAVLGMVQRWFSSTIGEGLIFDLRTQVFDHVIQMPVAFFTRTQTGKLVSRLNSDVIGAQQAFTSTLSTVLTNLISLVLVLAAMLVLSWQLTVAALIMLPIFLVPAKIVGRKLSELTRQQMELNGDMSATMTERFSVSGALLVKLFGRAPEEHDRFAERAGAVRDVSVKIAMNGRFFFTSLGLVASLAVALVYGVGGSLAIDGVLTVGTLTALAALLAQLYGPLTQLTNLRIDVMNALVSFDRVFEVLDLLPMIRDAEDAEAVKGPASVSFDHVSFTYPSADEVSLASLESIASLDQRPSGEVLHDVTFSVAAGQTVALVGRSGGGKTTMTHLIARLYDATSGTVSVAGIDVKKLKQSSLRATVGYVTQDAHMFHDTIRANLRYARTDATEAEMWEALEAAQIRPLVESLPDGLETVVGERGYRLSGGERQRLAIARLLLKAPSIVVLDEATAHLDSESEVAVQRALDLAMEGRTSVVIAHRLSTIRNADLIIVVDHGRIVQRGRHEELMREGGLYTELYRTQFDQSPRWAPPSTAITEPVR
jgi:ATP-binding cassette, subfamily B, bacterial